MYSKLFSTRPNTAVLLFFAPLHLPFVPSLFFRVNFTLNEIPLGLLAVQQRDVNYDLCSLYFFFSFLFSLSLSVSVSLSLSLLCLHWLRNMCVNRNFFTECIVHLHFCARARDPWPNWHCSVTCCAAFRSNSCLTAISLIAFQFEIRGNSREYLTNVNNGMATI